MTAEFCTLFDRNYLPRALVLYRSLESVCGDFRLRAFCMDEVTAPILRRLGLEQRSNDCRACDGCYEQRFTHDLPLRPYGQYAFALFA